MQDKEKIKTRFAPSPTGSLHLGGARSALFNYLFAKQNNGTFVVRIEDTDKERSKKEYEDDIKKGLTWLGITWDHIHTQQEEKEYHKKVLQTLINNGVAYISKEKIKKEGDRPEVIRFKNPKTPVTFNDIIRGEVTMETESLGDFVIAKNLEEPLYHLAVVADDEHHAITHVIRGEDHISNTPRQILIQRALGYKTPTYAHLPLILAPDKTKLSKRHGATSVTEFMDMGYLREALLNYLVLLGWHPKNDTELLEINDMIRSFKLEDVQKGGAIFDIEKLNWLNRNYMSKLSEKDFYSYATPYIPSQLKNHPGYKKILAVERERIQKGQDIKTLHDIGEFDYFYNTPKYDDAKIGGQKNPPPKEDTVRHIETLISAIKELPVFDKLSIKEAIWKYAEQNGKGSVLWPMRYALSGKDRSPDPFVIAEILGKEETILRLKEVKSRIE